MDDATHDAELLAAWSSGSRSAGDVLIDRYFEVVHRFFRNKVGAEIDDLVQQTFLGCVEARASYRREASFKTFLLAIARNQLFMHYRRTRNRADFSVSSICDLGTSPTGVIARRQEEQLVAQALQRVSLDAQVILELAYWEGLGGTAIAEVLDVPLNTAYSRLQRAKQSLRECLRELAPDEETLMRSLQVVGAAPERVRGTNASDSGCKR